MGFYYPPASVRMQQAGGFTAGPDEPTSPAKGDVWVDVATGQTKVWWVGRWRPVGLDTPTTDRYGLAATVLPGLQQSAAG